MNSNCEIEARVVRESITLNFDSPDIREALSKRYSNDIVILLPLRSGRFAVFNSLRECFGTVEAEAEWRNVWRAPEEAKPKVLDLKELGLL